MLALFDAGHDVLFVDEAVFTSKQIQSRVWYFKGEKNVTVPKRALGFKAIAVVAAIDRNGRVIGLTLADGSIGKHQFRYFIDSCTETRGQRTTHLFLDNLRLHHMKEIKEYAAQKSMSLWYNAAYSPQLNPIEFLWAYAKRNFKRHCIHEADFKNRSKLYRLVREAILDVPATYL